MYEASTVIPKNNDIITWIFISVGFLLFILSLVYRQRLSLTSTFFLTEKYGITFYSADRNKSIFGRYYTLFFFLINILTFVMLIYCIFPENNSFLFTFIALLLFCILDYVIKYGLSILFEYKEEQNYATYLKSTYMNNITLWVLPFLLVYLYSPYFHLFLKWFLISFVLILLGLRYFFVIFKYKKIIRQHLFYFILYICTLEISPLLLFIKWVS